MALNPMPAITIAFLVALLTAAIEGDEITDLFWQNDWFIELDDILPPVKEGGWDAEINTKNNQGGFIGFLVNLFKTAADVVAEAILLVAQIFYTIARIITQVFVWVFNVGVIAVGGLLVIWKFQTLNVLGAPIQLRAAYSVIINGWIGISLYQHYRKM